mgnify:CR=1 FL=1
MYVYTQARFTHERQNFESLRERRGTLASPNTPLSQDTQTHKQGLHTKDKFSNTFVKREVHGEAQTLPCHMTHEHSSKIYINTQDAKVWMPWWKERCMGKPETLPCHKTHKHKWQKHIDTWVKGNISLLQNNRFFYNIRIILQPVGYEYER